MLDSIHYFCISTYDLFADRNNATMSCGFKQLLEQVKIFFRLLAKFLGRFNA